MIQITDKQNCCGCEACVQRCPKQCITMQSDHEGFLYPKVNEEICIHCGLCEKVCPIINTTTEREPLKILGAKANNDEIVRKSSSGGIFSLIAEKVLNQNGVIFGAKFDKNWNVVHDYTDNINELDVFRRSKYVQSLIGDTFQKAEDFLKAGRLVLFTGTPCQIKGLKLFLRKDYKNLLTVDFVCHGVPSPAVWNMYLDAYIKKTGIQRSNIKQINFRDKKYGWNNFSLTIATNEISTTETLSKNLYMRLFLSNIILRPSCYSCMAKGGKSKSDITIADFWGIEKIFPKCNDDTGYSLILVNTSKGEGFIPPLSYKTSDYKTIRQLNGGLNAHIITPQNREKFFRKFPTFTESNFLSRSASILQIPMKLRIRYKLIKVIKKILRK